MENSFFCKLLPKIELHAHLNGSISIETLKELRRHHSSNGDCVVDDKAWAEWEDFFLRTELSTLSECFEIFKVAHSVTITPEAVQLATERVIEDFAKDNVIYLELRSTLRKEPKMTKSQYLEAMISGVKACKIDFPDITVKLIVSVNRRDSLIEARENVDLAIEYSKMEPEIIVGVDISGDPYEKRFVDYVDMLNEARREGLKSAVHFGEVPGEEEIRAILDYRPDRLGHGTCVHESLGGGPELWESLLASRIPVEVCITSNIKCKTVPSVDKHHFRLLYNANHPLVLATDDKSVFQTNLSDEYEIVKSTFKLSDDELWKLSYNSVNYVFASDAAKDGLRERISAWKNSFGG